MPESIPTKPE